MLTLTIGPKGRLRPIRFPREKAGRKTVILHGHIHQDVLFDPSTEQ